RSAPLQYGPDESASQNRWASKLASTLSTSLLHVTRRDLLLRSELLHRAVLLQRRNRTLERLAQLRVGLPIVDPEGVGLGEEVRDRQVPGMLFLLVRPLGVLREHRVRAPDQQLSDRVGVAGIPLQVHLRLAGRL